MENKWEVMDNRGISFSLNNHDGLLWEVLIFYKEEDRQFFIGKLTEKGIVPYSTNYKKNEEYEYRLMWAEDKILFFRRKNE
ncbi:hypothetical protein CCP3SC1AL1_520017 [Gammaproteobacteria bacterium]